MDQLFNNDRVRSAKFFDVIEFNRAVHAEMSALMSCARNGISTVDAILYCTTFPCHECSRHLIAAGISRVVYVEPYSKSRVLDLHADAVLVEKFTGPPYAFGAADDGADSKLVRFEPFVGFAPRSQDVLYSSTKRKLEGVLADPSYIGRRRFWSLGPHSQLRSSLVSSIPATRAAEASMMRIGEQSVQDELNDAGLTTPGGSDATPHSDSTTTKAKSDRARAGTRATDTADPIQEEPTED